MTKYWITVLALFFAAGCGREVPEGYAPVRLRLGGDPAPNMMTAIGILPTAPIAGTPELICPMEKLVLRVFGPGISNPLAHAFDAPKVNLTAFAGAATDQVFQQQTGVRLLVPKGPERRFVVTGLFRATIDGSGVPNGCDPGDATFTMAYPIFGGSPLVNIDQPVSIGLKAWVPGSGFKVEQLVNPGAGSQSPTVDITGTPFMALNVTWDFTLDQSAYVSVRSVVDDERLTTLSGMLRPPVAKGALWRLAPLVPGKRYEISLIKSGGNTYRFYYDAKLEASEQSVSFGLLDAVVAAVP